MRWRHDLIPGLAASALFHAAACAALIMETAPPSTTGVLAIAVTLVIEPAKGTAPDPEELATTMSDGIPAISPEPLLEPVPSAVHTAPAVITPSAQFITVQQAQQRHRRPTPRSDAVVAVTLAPPTRDPPPSSMAEATTRADDSVITPPIRDNGPERSGYAAATPSSSTASPVSTAYLAAIMTWLERHKEYPDEARSRHEEGTVLIAFVIDRDGQVLSFNIRRSSGSFVLDKAAEDLIHRADPLPPPPATYPGPRLQMVLPLTFALQ